MLSIDMAWCLGFGFWVLQSSRVQIQGLELLEVMGKLEKQNVEWTVLFLIDIQDGECIHE